MTRKQTTSCLTILAGISIFILNTDIFFSRLMRLDHAYLCHLPLPLGLATNIILLAIIFIGYIRATNKSETYPLDHLLPIFLIMIMLLTYIVRIDEFNATLFRKASFLYKVVTVYDKQNVFAALLTQSTFIGLITHSVIKRINKTN